MPDPAPPILSRLRVLSFDCYGTLIDWERGILDALAPLLARAAPAPAPEAALEAFAREESRLEAAEPALPYPLVLARTHAALAGAWGAAADPAADSRFGACVPDWPAFPDSPDALAALARHARLVILSNVDRASFAGSARRLGAPFHRVITAEDVGCYKPDPRGFAHMLRVLAGDGIAPDEVLHVAQSLFHDHVPAQAAGLATCWVDRRGPRDGWGATPPPPVPVTPDLRVPDLATLAGLLARAAR